MMGLSLITASWAALLLACQPRLDPVTTHHSIPRVAEHGSFTVVMFHGAVQRGTRARSLYLIYQLWVVIGVRQFVQSVCPYVHTSVGMAGWGRGRTTATGSFFPSSWSSAHLGGGQLEKAPESECRRHKATNIRPGVQDCIERGPHDRKAFYAEAGLLELPKYTVGSRVYEDEPCGAVPGY
ncbi:hypothetical protein F4861DRAFT_259629 [Xylaria intraflava]|nr:hypothetical protein F4861DRAFT_259629 [Xylaria intraflava]